MFYIKQFVRQKIIAIHMSLLCICPQNTCEEPCFILSPNPLMFLAHMVSDELFCLYASFNSSVQFLLLDLFMFDSN